MQNASGRTILDVLFIQRQPNAFMEQAAGALGGFSMKKNNTTEKWMVGKIALPVLAVLAAVFLLWKRSDLSVQALLAYTPGNPVVAACVMLVMYGVKSATVVFPLAVIELTAGYLFSTGTALLVNFLGMLIIMTVPYWIGRLSGMDVVARLTAKFPKFGEFVSRQQENSFFLCFFLRLVGCLPCDLVTLYLGATKTSFWQNLTAGTLGILPSMILTTLLGSSIQDPTSPMFWVSVGLTALLSVSSAAAYRIYKRRKKPVPAEKDC